MSRNLRDGVYIALVLLALAFLVSCGNVGAAPISGLGGISAVSVQITPPSITVGTNSVTPFTATVNGAGLQTVQWQVNGLPGGAPEIGTIDSSGNYTAPQFVPIPANVVITAIADADNTRSGTASVNITGTLYPATVYMSPTGTAYVQKGTQMQLSAGITGPADTAVVWQVNGVQNGNSKVGTIAPGANGNAVYTAPTVLPSPPTVTIQAVSHAEPDRSNSVTVALSNTPPTIATVTISPVFAVVEGGTSFTFNASVIGASDTSVSWYVHSTPGGDTTYGTIAGVNATQGSYTAPFTVPKTGSTVYPVVASNAQPGRTTAAAVTISPPPPLSVSATVSGATSVLVGTQQTYIASLLNATNQAVTWQVNGITGGNSKIGTIVQSTSVPNQGDYTAPDTVPVPAAVVIGAVPVQDPKVAGTLPVIISTPPVVVDVVCTPFPCAPGAKIGVSQQQGFEAEISGIENLAADWYVCTQNSNPSNCTLGGNSIYGTISPATGTNDVVYTAPANVPSPSLIIIKATPEGAPNTFGTTTLMITLQAISVQVQPPGPFTVPINDSAPPFLATVLGSQDQTVSWYVNGILNGNSTVGTMVPDSQNIGYEDYIAPAQIPNPATVAVTAVPEADPNVVSNAVQITIVLPQGSIEISPPPTPLLPGQFEDFSGNVQIPGGDQTIDWSLSLPPNEGTSCFDPNTPCGTIVPQQTLTNGQPVVYTAPATTGNGGQLPDPWYVNLTATSDGDKGLFTTVTIKITQNASASISILPGQPQIQAGSTEIIPFTLYTSNLPDDIEVLWQPYCNSLAPPGENCGPNFGQYQDGGGPGCFTYTDANGNQVTQCNDKDSVDPVLNVVNYAAPKVLGSDYMQEQLCNTQPGQTDGFVPFTATVNSDNCQPQGTCFAYVCIQISPPGAK